MGSLSRKERGKTGERLFGTDGVRGIANLELTPELAFDLGRAGAYVLTKSMGGAAENGAKHPKILIGTDGRASGDMLKAALSAGMCSVGATVYSVGIMPTPAAAYLVRKHGLDAGVVISASHNPAKYNGIKFFDGDGYKLPDSLENEIEEIVFSDEKMEELPRMVGGEIGSCGVLESSALDDYAEFLKSCASKRLEGLKIVLDCANGAAYKVAPKVFSELGADVIVINDAPDGVNINDNCGSTHMEQLVAEVKKHGADAGFAFDGDADRCLAVSEKGEIVDGDMLMSLLGLHMKKRKELKKIAIVATVMSNLGFFIMAEENGITVPQTQVGDRYVLETMLAEGYNLGGEQSGHIIFLDHNTTGDGVMTAVKTLSVMAETGEKLSELASVMKKLPQSLVNARVSNDKKYNYLEDDEIRAAVEEIESRYAGRGRALIRPSGTEPLVRVMIEGEDEADIRQSAEKLAKLIEERLK